MGVDERNSDNFINKRMGNCHMGYRILCMDVDSKGNP